jgi:lysozyme family protein
MANFSTYFPTLLKHEGGFVNHPKDPGGATNKGVTFQTFKLNAKPLLGIEPTLDSLKALSDEQALKIYRVKYWAPVCGDEIKSQRIAEFLFDFYVNAGKNGVRVLQKLLVDRGFKITVDGVCGPETYEAVNRDDERPLFNAYKQRRIAYYHALIARKPECKVFLKGWLNRVNSFPDF